MAALVPMDGYHLDNAILDARGRRFEKGSPDTFDVAGFAAMLRRLKTEDEVIIPVFDRDARSVARIGPRRAGPEARIAVVEGNYLLLRDAPWNGLSPLWDLTVFLDVPEAELERRLVDRWLHHGLDPRQHAIGPKPTICRMRALWWPGRLRHKWCCQTQSD